MTDFLVRKELENLKYGQMAKDNFWNYLTVGLHREVAKAVARLHGSGKIPVEPLEKEVLVRLMGYDWKEALNLLRDFEKDQPYVEHISMEEYVKGLFTDPNALI